MKEAQPRAIQLKDYAPPPFRVETVELEVDIREDHALVRAKLEVRRNGKGSTSAPLVLDGDELELVSVALDGKPVRHEVTAEKLTVPDVPDAFTLETVSRIVPQKNTKLEGLYATKHGFVTQCEAEGFRRITWFIDRPDVMARYTTTVRADPKKYPVLLSNGNKVASGEGWAKFVDPFPKPSYLFALVAANLEVLKEGNLSIYVEPGKLDQAGWAMDCLKRAIAWDEQGPQHLQHALRPRARGHRHRRGLPEHRPRGGARVFPQLDRQGVRLGGLTRLPVVAEAQERTSRSWCRTSVPSEAWRALRRRRRRSGSWTLGL